MIVHNSRLSISEWLSLLELQQYEGQFADTLYFYIFTRFFPQTICSSMPQWTMWAISMIENSNVWVYVIWHIVRRCSIVYWVCEPSVGSPWIWKVAITIPHSGILLTGLFFFAAMRSAPCAVPRRKSSCPLVYLDANSNDTENNGSPGAAVFTTKSGKVLKQLTFDDSNTMWVLRDIWMWI